MSHIERGTSPNESSVAIAIAGQIKIRRFVVFGVNEFEGTIEDLFRCLSCGHKWNVLQPKQPWYGMGHDKDLNPMHDVLPNGKLDERIWIPPRMSVNPTCPQCGHVYVSRLS